MIYILASLLWPLLAVGIYFVQPLLFPDEPPPSPLFLTAAALLGMCAFAFAGTLRLMGYLRDDKRRTEKSREPDI